MQNLRIQKKKCLEGHKISIQEIFQKTFDLSSQFSILGYNLNTVQLNINSVALLTL